MDASPASLAGDSAPPSRRVAAPEPNPSFTFPMLPPAPSSKDENGPSGGIPSPLAIPIPHSPGMSSGDSDRLDIPQISPNRGAFMQRSRGHLRAGSEFIGGDGSKAGPGLMSTSPTKGPGTLPSPPASMGRRRGHAHRRSGAISHHDLSAILKPREQVPLPDKPGSLPTSPTVEHPHSLDRATSQPTLNSINAAQALMDAFAKASPAEDEAAMSSTPSSAPPSRPRVGFSDTLEFIPRPLSIISSESSISTIRPTHSAAGSISSIASIGTSSPPSAKKNQYTHDVLQRYRQASPRPATADSMEPPNRAVEDSPSTRVKRPSSPGAGAILKAAKSPLIGPPPASSKAKASKPKATESTFQEFPSLWRNPPSYLPHELRPSGSDPELQERPRSSPETKSAKRPKKVKSWAESILSIRSKGKAPEDSGEPSPNDPSHRKFAPFQDFSMDDVNFDDDNTCVIKSPDYKAPEPTKSPTRASESTFDDDDEAPIAIFDLDAAWDELDENDKGGSYRSSRKRTQRRPLNSSTFNTGTQYHRRTESAPALTPISATSGLIRRANESPMADVFEEDEEEAQEQGHPSADLKNSVADDEQQTEEGSLAVTVVDHNGKQERPLASPRAAETDSSSQDENDVDRRSALSQLSEIQTPRDASGLPDIPVEIVDTVDEPRFSVITKSSDESTVTPTLPGSPPEELQRELGLTVSFAYNERHAASVPEAISFAVPQSSSSDRRNPTTSSLRTEASTIGSNKFNEAGFVASYSAEDVPSLTSSASTTASVRAANLTHAFPRPSADRSHSFSGVSGRAHNSSAVKRASLASLSRLVGSSYGSSYGERSKLSLEVLANDDRERSEKKKRNRISKLVKFWKSKEKTTTA